MDCPSFNVAADNLTTAASEFRKCAAFPPIVQAQDILAAINRLDRRFDHLETAMTAQ